MAQVISPQARKADAFYYLAWSLLPFVLNTIFLSSIGDASTKQILAILAPILSWGLGVNLFVVSLLAMLRKRDAAVSFLIGSALPWLWLSYFLFK
ncbi:hypothetical protein [Hymenobacter saemangeumensis]|uniref:hypothetical protein n=1 Tax=Hymenobacter saemangeumensis TaxID=1084522 RepID=UPI0031EDDA32